jgi:hypothetical protein
MATLSGFKILIIDFPEACLLRTKLMAAGAAVYVVNPRGALILAQHRHIDAAFVGFSMAAETRRLCEQLSHLGVGQIIVTPGDIGTERLEKERDMLPDVVLGMSRAGTQRPDLTLH